MLCRGDLAELVALADPYMAVQVVKHDYSTRSPRKYVGTDMEADNLDYPRKNWSSVVLWNCNSHRNRYTAEFIEKAALVDFHRFAWLDDMHIGSLPAEWNHLVSEQPDNPKAKIAHFTLGIPGFTHYQHSEYSAEWRDTLRRTQRGL